MQKKTQILDAAAVSRALARITHEIIERSHGAEDICLLGVKTRGVPLAQRLADNLYRFEGIRVPVGLLDVTHHRDDLTEAERESVVGECLFPCDVTGRTVIIVDDVLYTGRTARAAMEAVFAAGRAGAIRLAVLVDRGHRELPIRPDYVGKIVPTSKTEKISVLLTECDGEDGAYICEL